MPPDLSMKVENVPAFTERFEAFVTEHILPEQTSPVIEIDAEIDFRDITPKFYSDLKKFNPFGPRQSEADLLYTPRLRLRNQ